MSALRDRPRVAAALAILTVLLVASGWVIGMASAGGGDAGDRIRLERAELAITAAQREVRDLRQQTGRLQVRAGELEQQRHGARSPRPPRRRAHQALAAARPPRGAPRPPPSGLSAAPNHRPGLTPAGVSPRFTRP